MYWLKGLDTVQANLELGFAAELRTYIPVKYILSDLGISKIKLMTNNPFKIRAIKSMGISVTARIPIVTGVNEFNCAYLRTKANRMEHMLPLDGYARNEEGI